MGLRLTTWMAILLLLSSCTSDGCNQISGPTDAELKTSLLTLSDDLAAAISSRDPEGAARGVRQDSHVAYVSDGNIIRGHEYRDVLRNLYDSMSKIDFQWDMREVERVGDSGGVVTGWASISLVDQEGSSSTDTAIFTLVYGHSAGTWELVTAQKTTVR